MAPTDPKRTVSGATGGRSTHKSVAFNPIIIILILAASVFVEFIATRPRVESPLVVLGSLGWTSAETILPPSVFALLTQIYQTIRHLYYHYAGKPQSTPQTHLTIPPYYSFDNIWTTNELVELTSLVKEIGSFASLTRDQTSLIDHIGEGAPLNPDGSCPHPYLIPNLSRTLCVLATRVDVGVHYLMSGGPSGRKEALEPLLARTLSFSKFFITNPLSVDKQKETSSATLNLPALKSLFESRQYLEASKSVCNGLTHLDPFQLGVILQLPGQQLGVHLDVPWFFGANRFHFPQWLLVVMRSSGLWEDRAVRQVQGVAYLHEWSALPNETNEQYLRRNGGAFQYWTDSTTTIPKQHLPIRNSAIILDGSIIPHGTGLFRPSDVHTLPVDQLRRNSSAVLKYSPASDDWSLEVDGRPIRSYALSDVRISLVWRAMCFSSEAERIRYHSPDQTINPDLKLEVVLETLRVDLHTRGYIVPSDPLELALLLLDVYVDYPWPTQSIPFNYCIIPGTVGDAIRYVAC